MFAIGSKVKVYGSPILDFERIQGPVLISGVRPSALRWHCHTSAVGGQVFPPNPMLPSHSDCYSFISRHLGSTRLSQPCGASGVNPLPSDLRAGILTTQLSSRT